MSTSSGASSYDDEHLPRGMPKRRRGWEGEDMELQRDDAPAEAAHAAVDLGQFRNTEVGKGYQAKHVVRQRTGKMEGNVVKVKDMTISSSRKKEGVKKSSQKSKMRKTSRDDGSRKRSSAEASKSERLKKYLKCDGLRRFRRELESIHAES